MNILNNMVGNAPPSRGRLLCQMLWVLATTVPFAATSVNAAYPVGDRLAGAVGRSAEGGLSSGAAPDNCGKTFQFIDSSGQHRTAQLGNTGPTNPFGAFHDPEWQVSPAWRPAIDNDWLPYKGKDGGSWLTKVHIKGQRDGIGWDFESKHPGAANGKNGSFLVLGWDGRPIQITGLRFDKDPHDKDNYGIRICVAPFNG